jgi:hypothetical protein
MEVHSPQLLDDRLGIKKAIRPTVATCDGLLYNMPVCFLLIHNVLFPYAQHDVVQVSVQGRTVTLQGAMWKPYDATISLETAHKI